MIALRSGLLAHVMVHEIAHILKGINARGVVIHAGASTTVSPGSLADVYGTDLAIGPPSTASGDPLSTMMGGVQMLVNKTAAPLIYVSPQQLIFQAPYETTVGTASVQVVSAGQTSAVSQVTVQPSAPSVLTYGANRAVVFNPDGSVNSSGNGARPGDVLVAYLIGSGPLDNPIPTGATASSAPLSRETLPITVTIGSAGSNQPLLTVSK